MRLLIAGLALLPTALAGQALRGRVVDAVQGGAVPGAAVELQDSVGRRIERVLSTSSGTFSFSLQTGGRYTLRAFAIGYNVGAPKSLEVPTGGSATLDVSLSPFARALPDIALIGSRRVCGGDVARDPFIVMLMAAANTSLEVAEATVAAGTTFSVEVVTRKTVTVGRRVISRTDTIREPLARWPVESEHADSLRVNGFSRPIVRSGGRAGMTYFGPDARVLLAPWFFETHCYALLPPAADDQFVRVRFEPTRGHRLVDIAGTITIDPADFALREIQFEHRNLPSGIPVGSSGGIVSFGRLEGGGWVPQRWHLFGPVPPVRPPLNPPRILDLGTPPPNRRSEPPALEMVSVTGRVVGRGGGQ